MNCKGFKKIYIIMSVIFILSGICMLMRPDFFAYALCYIIGGICIAHGIMRLAGYFSKDLYRIAFQFDLALGIASILVGIIIIFNSVGFLTLIPIIIGIFTLLSGTLKIQSAIDAKRFGLSKWWLLLLGAIITMILGVALIACPFESILAIVSVLGFTLVLDGIQNLFVLFYTVKYRNN